MKKLLLLLFMASFASVDSIQAQGCQGYFPMNENTSFEVTSYNKKGKVETVTENVVKYVTNEGDVTSAKISTAVSDKKGELLTKGEYDVECADGKFSIDMSTRMAADQMKGMENMEAEISSSALIFPSELSVGQDLPDGDMEIELGSGGVKIMTMKMNISDRKVEAKESITTPAGTFECFKITYTYEIKTIMKKKFQMVEWLAKDVGMVRTETRNKKGKLISYQEMTKFEKG